MTKKQSPLRKLHPNIWVVTATSFLTDVSSEMIVYLIPLFLANILGVRTAVIGLIDGVAETTASLLKIYSGALSDKLGKRKGLAVLGYGLSTIAKPFLYFANTWGWVLGVRFADRTGKGIRTAPRDALVAASTDEKSRGLAFGLHRAGDTAGAFLGLGIAAVIIWLTQSGARRTDPQNLPDGGAGQHPPGGFGGHRFGVGSERSYRRGEAYPFGHKCFAPTIKFQKYR